MIKCSECQKNIINMTAYQKWLRLVNYFDLLLTEQDITVETHERFMDDLMGMKYLVCQAEEASEK